MRLLIFSNIYISFAAAALALQSYYLLGAREFLRASPHGWGPAALIFCGTLVVYNLDRLVSSSREDAIETTDRHRWIGARKKRLWTLAALGALGGAASLFFVPASVIWGLIPLAAVALAYSLPLLGRKFGRSAPDGEGGAPDQRRALRLKDIPGLKIFLIALVWAAVTVVLPALHASIELLSREVILVFFERMLFIFAITLPFDVRDLERDLKSGIRTLPMSLGARGTRRLAVAAMVVFSIFVVFHEGLDPAGPTIPLVAGALLTGVALGFCDRARSELYYVGLLDGAMLAQSILVIAYLEMIAHLEMMAA
jgi:4-hydroxybenzoate polyprenyltransferase